VICEAFVEGRLEAPKHLARTVHDLYFEPKYEEFRRQTIWSLSNAFTSAFKKLEPIPQFRASLHDLHCIARRQLDFQRDRTSRKAEHPVSLS
jgi:hypothetical protein